jgi:hypothetical protein
MRKVKGGAFRTDFNYYYIFNGDITVHRPQFAKISDLSMRLVTLSSELQ